MKNRVAKTGPALFGNKWRGVIIIGGSCYTKLAMKTDGPRHPFSSIRPGTTTKTTRSGFGWKLVKIPQGDLILAKIKVTRGARVKRMEHDETYFAADRVEVADFFYRWGSRISAPGMVAISLADESFQYEKGKVIKPSEPFDEDATEICGSGIYFCLDKSELDSV